MGTETVTAEEFATLYANYGYGGTSTRDAASLSYVCEPIEGVVVIGLDSNRSKENLLKSRGDSINTYQNAGSIQSETLQWAVEQAKQAKQASDAGKHVIVMMHHHLLEHFDNEAEFLSKYIVAGHESIRDKLLNAGVHTVLTGHLHVSDIARDYNSDRSDSLTEIATGSLSTYPFHYREITIKKEKLIVSTNSLRSIPSHADLLASGKAQVEKVVSRMMDVLARKAWKKVERKRDQINAMLATFGGGNAQLPSNPEPFIQFAHQNYDDAARKAYVAFLEGNEGKNKDCQITIKQFDEGIKAALMMTLPDKMGEMLQETLQSDSFSPFRNLIISIFEDRNHCGTKCEVVVDDLSTDLRM